VLRVDKEGQCGLRKKEKCVSEEWSEGWGIEEKAVGSLVGDTGRQGKRKLLQTSRRRRHRKLDAISRKKREKNGNPISEKESPTRKKVQPYGLATGKNIVRLRKKARLLLRCKFPEERRYLETLRKGKH